MSAARRKLGAVGRAGLGGAPGDAERLASPTGSSGPTTSRRHEPTRPVQYTLRFSYDESDQVADLARGLRRDLGRAVDQSEVLRTLAELAAADPAIRAALVQRLQGR